LRSYGSLSISVPIFPVCWPGILDIARPLFVRQGAEHKLLPGVHALQAPAQTARTAFSPIQLVWGFTPDRSNFNAKLYT
jgi:hypothetical protein